MRRSLILALKHIIITYNHIIHIVMKYVAYNDYKRSKRLFFSSLLRIRLFQHHVDGSKQLKKTMRHFQSSEMKCLFFLCLSSITYCRRALHGIQLKHKRDIMKSYIMKPALSVTNVAHVESFDSSRKHTNRKTMSSVSSSKQSKLKPKQN